MSTLELSSGVEVSVRLRTSDSLAFAEVMSNDEGRHTAFRLLTRPESLRSSDFARGVDIERIEDGDRYAVEDVEVEDVDLNEGILHVPRLLALPRVARRANFREPAQLPVRLEVDGQRLRAETLELGGGGFSFRTRRPLQSSAGTPVHFALELEDAPLEGEAIISWLSMRSGRPAGGLRFTQVDKRATNRLYGLLYRLQARRRR